MGVGGIVDHVYYGPGNSSCRVNQTLDDLENSNGVVRDSDKPMAVVHVVDMLTVTMNVTKSISTAASCMPGKSNNMGGRFSFLQQGGGFAEELRKHNPVLCLKTEYARNNVYVNTNIRDVNIVTVANSKGLKKDVTKPFHTNQQGTYFEK